MSLILLLTIYFVPWIIAVARERKHSRTIFLANLFAGWTVVGWIVVLAWALVDERLSFGTTVVAGEQSAGKISESAFATGTRPAMSFRPSTPEECEGFQMLGFGVCCATCEWAGDECPFAKNSAAHPNRHATAALQPWAGSLSN